MTRQNPLLGLVWLLTLASSALALDVPFLSGRINDHATLLSAETEQRLDNRLKALEEASGAQVAVLTLPGLAGENLEEFSLRVARTWQLGRKDVNDGVLLLVARDDRQLRIEVGYGLESVLTDADSGLIISQLMVPRFRQGDFAGGIEAALTAIDGKIRGIEGALPVAASTSHGSDSGVDALAMVFAGLVLLPFVYLAIALQGASGWFLYAFIAGFIAIFALAIGPTASLVAGLSWVLAIPPVRYLWPERWKLEAQDGSGSGGSGGGFSGGSYSGGSFSGGGGSFGGGGASGSW